jgi:WD40 repeat protein/serine/threonine protein kinase
VFLEALEQPTSQDRAAYLERACAGKPALRAAVEALLQSHKEDDFLETPVVLAPRPAAAPRGPSGTIAIVAVSEQPGDRIGRYKLLQQIGEGGAGTVFMAEQEEPVRRRVALKVLKPGMDTKSVIARFETERQALAMMDHANIAKVLDAGATDTGRPYFVMELVRGIRITEYCDQYNLPTRERLRLFIQVCQAIQHAHQKGIIHRDIKPSNILVALHDGVPVPKVIDFGIAKATAQRLTDKTFFTELRAFIGTPAYMSPEQAEMSSLDIDTRTDVYGLGVLLYELLTGKTPFDAQELISSSLDGMRRIIREREPVAPSTRLRTMLDNEQTATARRQQSEPAKLAGVLRGDLDWIVLKSLEKDRTRRYETASGLAMDVQRYLDNQPVIARPPSAIYLFQKLVRRNKLAFGAATAFAAALVIGLGLFTWQFVEKSQAFRRVSEAQREQSLLRREAETQALAARRKAYAADMNLVQQALRANNLGRAQELLNAQHPQPGQLDLRGWEWRYLWQLCQSDALFTLCQHSNEVCSLAVSADGKWVAVGDSDGALSVWNLPGREEVARLAAAGGRVQAAFSPAAPWLAFSSAEGPWFPSRQPRIRLWNASNRQYLTDLSTGGACFGLAFSEDGTKLIVATADSQLTTWSVPDGKRLASLQLPQAPRLGPPVQVSRDLSVAAYGLEGGKLCVVDLSTGKERWTAQAADENVMALAFSSDGKVLASGAGYVESSIRLWNAASGVEIGRLSGHRTWVSSLAFWPDGLTLASASGDQTIRLWDVAKPLSLTPRPEPSPLEAPPGDRPPLPWVPTLRPLATLRGHKLEVWSLALLPDNTRLVSGCKDGSVYVWDAKRLKRDQARTTLPEPVRAWRFAPDSRSILAVDQQGRLVRWQGVEFQDKQIELELGAGAFAALFSPDGRLLVAGMTNGSLRIWDLQQRTLLREWTPENVRSFPVGFLPPLNHLVTRRLGEDSFQEWDLTSGQEIQSSLSTQELGPRSAVAFSPEARWSFWLDAEGAGRLRDLTTSQERILDLNLKQIAQVAFSPDGRLFAAVSRLGTGCLWETAAARKAATLHGFLQGMNSVTFSPDGKRLAIGGDGNEAIKLWHVEGLQELLTLEGQGSTFNSVAFSPDGNVLAASNGQGILHIWRAPSLAQIERP